MRFARDGEPLTVPVDLAGVNRSFNPTAGCVFTLHLPFEVDGEDLGLREVTVQLQNSRGLSGQVTGKF